MREILFRGKDKDGKWHYAMSLARHVTEKGIITSYYIGAGNATVSAETVGQYTGLKDMNGNKIFEGDIVEEVYDTHRGSRYEVRMSEERGGWYPFAKDDGCGCCSWEVANSDYCEIIGNIHDNPELLKEGVDDD